MNIFFQYLLYQSIPIFIPILAVPGQEPGYSRPPPHPPRPETFSKKLKISIHLTDDCSKIGQNCSKLLKIARNLRKNAHKCAKLVENGKKNSKSTCFAGPINQHLFQYLLFMFSIPQYQYLLRSNSILSGILRSQLVVRDQDDVAHVRCPKDICRACSGHCETYFNVI